MTAPPVIRIAGPEDAPALHAAIARLAEHLGMPEKHVATPGDYARHGLGDGTLFRALLAEAGGATCGAATFLPEFSTLRGKPGVFLQDLWVAPEHRGSGLGRRLLAAVAREAAAWQAAYLTVSAHTGNPGAIAFYRSLGFTTDENELSFVAEGDAYTRLGETP
ncbi:MAG TPA: GNAT family N-acetyltransferase [Thermohalobaculum sp.]|nr:GNAT family N-acetyltransferase [Thermohalobaculum sp.]